ncbi:zinc finger protein RFP-like [Candoia aspera]|uniref:zinc finger protein RFP-like n=1 Tax=Candoia aspera TaxID=51853 RepID=UPI002FD7D243
MEICVPEVSVGPAQSCRETVLLGLIGRTPDSWLKRKRGIPHGIRSHTVFPIEEAAQDYKLRNYSPRLAPPTLGNADRGQPPRSRHSRILERNAICQSPELPPSFLARSRLTEERLDGEQALPPGGSNIGQAQPQSSAPAPPEAVRNRAGGCEGFRKEMPCRLRALLQTRLIELEGVDCRGLRFLSPPLSSSARGTDTVDPSGARRGGLWVAMENPVESLHREATCSVCLEYFRDPVSIPCGHSFCRACITQCWKEQGTNFSCPQCREVALQRNFRPNRELGNVVEITRRLSLHALQGAAGQEGGEERPLCEKHQEALKLFCSEEESLICCICREARAHRSHTVFPIEEAAQDYKKEIECRLQKLKEELEKLLRLKLAGEVRHQESLSQTDTERQKVVMEFEQAHHFLDEQEKLLLAQLKEMEREIVKHQKIYDTKVSDEIVALTILIDEIEEKVEQPDSEFLQDIRSTLCRFDKEPFQVPEGMPVKMEKRLEEFSEKNTVLAEMLKNLKDTLPSELGTEWVNITLDKDTANPQVIISEDRKSARWDVTRTDVPHNPKRFKSSCCVLGCEGFTAGRHYWEVNVEDGGIWAIGVARGSVRRKIELKLTPEEGIWALQGDFGQYQALTSPVTALPLLCTPRRIRVFLDYERGQVEFFNADTKDSIFLFSSALFAGERIFPFFKVLLAQLTLDG